jgi:hypothetical protein
VRASGQRSYRKNRERILENGRQRHALNPERRRSNSRRYRESDKGRLQEQQYRTKRYKRYRENIEKHRTRDRVWYWENRDKALVAGHKYRQECRIAAAFFAKHPEAAKAIPKSLPPKQRKAFMRQAYKMIPEVIKPVNVMDLIKRIQAEISGGTNG